MSYDNGERGPSPGQTVNPCERMSHVPHSPAPQPGAILFVCTGNTCRSPMAAGILRRLLDKRGGGAIMVDSAGLAAYGEPVSANAVAVMEEWGIDIRDHLSTPVTADKLQQADVIAVMSASHAARLSAMGVPPEKLHLLGGADGIPDPYGGDIACYRRVRDALADAIEQLADRLCL